MSTTDAEDRARFELLYTSTRVPILGYLLRRAVDPTDAADLLAETYLTAWRRVGDIPDGENARLWLYGVARRTLANYHRHRRAQTRLAETLRDQLIVGLPVQRASDDPHLADAIAVCLAALSATDREMIKLSAFEQLSPAEIAVVTGKSAGAFRVRLHRARRALRFGLIQAGYPPPDQLELAVRPASRAR